MDSTSQGAVSAEALSSQLSSSLPVYVSPDDVTKHPQLCHLLEDLNLRLTPWGTFKGTHTHLLNASHALKHARQKYLEECTLHHVSQDVLQNVDEVKGDKKGLKEMLEALTLSELQDHLLLVESEAGGEVPDDMHNRKNTTKSHRECTLFGITPDVVLAQSKAMNPEAHVKELSLGIETWLKQEWTKILSFVDPVGFTSYEPKEVTKVVERLEVTKQKLEEDSSKLVHNIIQTDALSQKVHGLLVNYCKLLNSLVSKQRLSQHAAQQLSSSVVTLNTHYLKLKCIQLELLNATYTSQSVPALKAIHAHLQQRRTQADQSLVKLRHAMESYKHLDPKFHELVKEYSKLQEDISFARRTHEANKLINPSAQNTAAL